MPLSLRSLLACSALLLSPPAWAADPQPAAPAKAKAKAKAKKRAAPDPLAPLTPPSPARPAPARARPAPAPAAGPAPTPTPTPIPTPTAPAAAQPEGYRSLEAYAPTDPSADAEASRPADAPVGPPRRLRVLPRVGIAVPRTELGVGPLAGVELGYRLPLLDDRIRLSLGAGYSFTSFKGSRIVPGRGLDPGFIQNTTLVPVELIASADVLPQEKVDGWGLAAGLGYGLYFTQSEILTLGGKSTEPSLAHAFVVALRVLRALGPGSLLLDARYSELRGDLGAFDEVGISTFSGFSFCLGYAFDL